MLSNGQIRLRPLSVSDAERLVLWRFSEENYDFFYEYFPVSVEQNVEWIRSVTAKQTEVNFVVERVSDKTPFGMISLVDIDMRNQKCEMARVLIGNSSLRKCGYGKQMLDLLLEYAFLHLNMHKVYCEVLANNKKAVLFYEKYGFRTDGVLKEHIYKSGCFQDVLHMTFFKEDFK